MSYIPTLFAFYSTLECVACCGGEYLARCCVVCDVFESVHSDYLSFLYLTYILYHILFGLSSVFCKKVCKKGEKPRVTSPWLVWKSNDGREKGSPLAASQLAIKIATAKIRVESYLVVAFLVVIVLLH